jgi:antitoxin component YwqK of YwqJK toxin-antitoxin module
MIGYLLGLVNKKVALVTIDFNERKSNISKNVIDKQNATYLCGTYKIIDIIDEYLNKYIAVDLRILLNEKMSAEINLKINEEYEKRTIFFYLSKERALQDIFLFNSKSTGIFKQYSLDGELIGELPQKNGILHGTYKSYYNGKVTEEVDYIKGYRIK